MGSADGRSSDGGGGVSPRTLLVGPLSPVHDALGAAALRGAGLAAEAIHPPSDQGLGRARALGNHGQCNPPHYAVGAVLDHARASGIPAAEFAPRHAWLTLGSCGPCRLAAFPVEWAQVLEGAGLGPLRMEPLEQRGFIKGLAGLGVARHRGLGNALVAALIAADALETLGHRLRPWVEEAPALEHELGLGTARVGAALEQGQGVLRALRDTARAARALAGRLDRILPRVLLVGEPWTTLTRGAPSYDVANRLERLGAEVDTPRVVDWLRYLVWQQHLTARLPEEERLTCSRASRRLASLWALFSGAVGLKEPLEDLDRIAALAEPWYPPTVLGGSGHLEVGRALVAAEDRSAHLVLSLKPFGCLPSSALSDGVLGPLLQRTAHAPAFLAIETTGDAHATVDSRLEMALEAATLRALDEFDAACSRRGLSPATARTRLAAVPLRGRRTFACTAAEWVVREEHP